MFDSVGAHVWLSVQLTVIVRSSWQCLKPEWILFCRNVVYACPKFNVERVQYHRYLLEHVITVPERCSIGGGLPFRSLRLLPKNILVTVLRKFTVATQCLASSDSVQETLQLCSWSPPVNSDTPGVDSCCVSCPWRCSWPSAVSPWMVSRARICR